MGLCIITGHYGTGKTNFALNLAVDAARRGEKTALCDLDVVNPYFRSSDSRELLEKNGVRLIAQEYAGTNLDNPSVPAELYSVFEGWNAILDAGGDDAGATILGQMSARIKEAGYELWYLLNARRNLTHTPQEAVEILREIEWASRLKATGLVNNTHLKQQTTAEVILESLPFAQEVSRLTGLPLLNTTAPAELAPALAGRVDNLYPVQVYVQTPWGS